MLTRRPTISGDVLHGKRVLVIEDDAMQAMGLEMLLQGWGCRVIVAASLDEARARLDEIGEAPDLALVDFRLGGGVSGIEAVKELRCATGVNFAAVLQTGDTDPSLAEQAKNHSFKLLHKPYTSELMRAELEKALADWA